MLFFNDHVFHKNGAHAAAAVETPHATAKPVCVIHPLNVPMTPGDAPQDFARYRLECLTIKTISSQGSDGTLTRRPALVVQMIMENAEDFGDGATYSLRTLASLQDLRILKHPQAAEATSKACTYYETKVPLAQQERVTGPKKAAKKTAAVPEPKHSLLARLLRI